MGVTVPISHTMTVQPSVEAGEATATETACTTQEIVQEPFWIR